MYLSIFINDKTDKYKIHLNLLFIVVFLHLTDNFGFQ